MIITTVRFLRNHLRSVSDWKEGMTNVALATPNKPTASICQFIVEVKVSSPTI